MCTIKVIVKDYPRDMRELVLYPLGDVHLGAKECMEKDFRDYVARIAEQDNAAVLLVGDLVNNGLKSSVTNVYDEKYSPRVQKQMMAEWLYPVRDKIIAAVTGNHERRSLKDADADVTRDILAEIGRADAYCGDAAFCKISLGKDRHNRRIAYMLYMSHGAGGGALLGSGISKVDKYQMTIEGIDISVTGHTHKPMKVPSARLIFDPHNNNVIRSNTLIYVCTSWLDYGGYPEQKMLSATAFYPDTITLSGEAKRWK